jgi:hypothetical protein
MHRFDLEVLTHTNLYAAILFIVVLRCEDLGYALLRRAQRLREGRVRYYFTTSESHASL